MLQFESQAYNHYPRASRQAAEMAEQQVKPNPNEFQFQFIMLDYEDLVPLELTHRTASGNVEYCSHGEKGRSP